MIVVHARCSKWKEEGPQLRGQRGEDARMLCTGRDALLRFENPTEVTEVRQ